MRITHEIDIPSSVESVWSITVDVESWPKWNPNVQLLEREDEGKFGIGSSAVISQTGLPPTRWTVIEFTEFKNFTWEAKVYGIKMRASHVLDKDGASTRNKLVIEAAGLLVYLLWPVLKMSFHKSLEAENIGLKKHVLGT